MWSESGRRRRRTYVGLEVDKFKNRQLQTVEEFKCKTLIDIAAKKGYMCEP